MALPRIIPLFPLPNVVLFPQVLLPLHIFEPRYRAMVKDVADGEGLIGMILLRDREEARDESGKDTYGVGCAGRMIRKVDLPDGRSNILLQGVREFIPREQTFDRPYRMASVDWRTPVETAFRLESEVRQRLLDAIRLFAKSDAGGLRILSDPTVTDEMLVNLFAFALDIPVAEKQGLLETDTLAERAARLVETLDFHNLEREFSPAADAAKFRAQ